MSTERGPYYRTFAPAPVLRGLMGCVLLWAVAGCDGSGQALPPLVLPGDTDATDVLPAALLDYRAGPACAEIGQPASTIHREMFEAVNLYRIEHGLGPLFYSRTLEEAADVQAEDLWVRSFFSHTNPSGEGPGDRALAAGFCHKYVGENIAAGQASVEEVMAAWKASPGHNANMLESSYLYVGVGVSVDGRGRRYWVQEFAYDVP